MPGEIVFHLGDEGSGLIRTALVRGAARAGGVTLSFPMPKRQHLLAQALAVRTADADLRDKSWGALAAQIAGAGADLTVVSAEGFGDVAPRALARAIGTFLPDHAGRIRLVSYVRPHAERLLSSYAQALGLGQFDGTLEAFHAAMLAEGRYLCAPRLAAWRDTFGPAFTLRPMVDDRLAGGDVTRDFLTLLFGDRPFTLDPLPRHDAGPDLAQLAMLHHFHRTAPTEGKREDAEARQRAAGHFARRLAAATAAGGARLHLHHALATRVQADYAADAAAVDAAFFPDDAPLTRALGAAVDHAVAVPQSLEIADHFDAEGCRQIEFWCRMVTHLLRRSPAEWGHHLGTLDPASGVGEDGAAAGNPGRPRQAVSGRAVSSQTGGEG